MKQPIREAFLPTRQSLLSRLRNWDDQDSWRQFFETYWRLIYDVAIRSGLDDAAAQDVVQETILAAAKQLPGFRYEPGAGSFKGWLLQITRRRIADSLRAQYRARGLKSAPTGEEGWQGGESPGSGADPDGVANPPEREPAGTAPADFEAIWDSEWNGHLAHAALDRLKARVNPRHFQAFELMTREEWSPGEVARSLGLNIAQVYLVRSRLRRQLRQELERLEREPGF